jgi:hypothetical protein
VVLAEKQISCGDHRKKSNNNDEGCRFAKIHDGRQSLPTDL